MPRRGSGPSSTPSTRSCCGTASGGSPPPRTPPTHSPRRSWSLWRQLDAVPAGREARYWLLGVARRVVANACRGDAPARPAGRPSARPPAHRAPNRDRAGRRRRAGRAGPARRRRPRAPHPRHVGGAHTHARQAACSASAPAPHVVRLHRARHVCAGCCSRRKGRPDEDIDDRTAPPLTPDPAQWARARRHVRRRTRAPGRDRRDGGGRGRRVRHVRDRAAERRCARGPGSRAGMPWSRRRPRSSCVGTVAGAVTVVADRGSDDGPDVATANSSVTTTVP